jgi:DNA-binding NtrC family response regulator
MTTSKSLAHQEKPTNLVTESHLTNGLDDQSHSLTSAWRCEAEKARRFANYEGLAILILGETGTGKTRLARQLHAWSPRRERPFIEVDCTSISPSLAESELFGHVRGAFTDAVQDRTGKIRKAHTGTLFLDEIGELDVSVQSKLLKVLEDKILIPVGSEERIPVDLRIIVATNRDLEAMVREGRFRRDLFERIRHVLLRLPPLRMRMEEIQDIALSAIEEWNRSNGEAKCLGEQALRAMLGYAWPGNIRELINAVRYACALCPGFEILSEHLPECVTEKVPYEEQGREALNPILPDQGLSLKEALRDFEWGYFRMALRRSGGNAAKAAVLLDMSGHAFRKALRERFSQRLAEG